MKRWYIMPRSALGALGTAQYHALWLDASRALVGVGLADVQQDGAIRALAGVTALPPIHSPRAVGATAAQALGCSVVETDTCHEALEKVVARWGQNHIALGEI